MSLCQYPSLARTPSQGVCLQSGVWGGLLGCHTSSPPPLADKPILPGLLVPLHDGGEASSSFPLDVLSRSPPLSVSRLRLSPVGLVWAEMSNRDIWGQCKHELKVCMEASEHWGSHQTWGESDAAMASAKPCLLRVLSFQNWR